MQEVMQAGRLAGRECAPRPGARACSRLPNPALGRGLDTLLLAAALVAEALGLLNKYHRLISTSFFPPDTIRSIYIEFSQHPDEVGTEV